jgi:N-acetylglucosamine-6-phosphate deacetylase
MNRTLITDARLVLADQVTPAAWLLIEEGRIARISAVVDEPTPDGCENVVNARGGYLAPGFIDLHIHGTRELLVDNGAADMTALSALLPRYGVTGFLPTTIRGAADGDLLRVGELAAADMPGARALGLHFEGPFVALGGAIPPGSLGRAGVKLARELAAAAGDFVPVFTVSPEIDEVLQVIGVAREAGGRAFISHTAATASQTRAAIDAGARHATHFYNVFPVREETEPGCRPCGAVEAVLADQRASVDFILDGEHVELDVVRLALDIKGKDNVALITDANIGADLPAGLYHHAGQELVISERGRAPRLGAGTAHPGALAGSGLTMDRAVRNAIAMLGLQLHQAVGMASSVPASVLGLEAHKGRIAEGFDADLVLLGDDLEVVGTWVGGEKRYSHEGGADT